MTTEEYEQAQLIQKAYDWRSYYDQRLEELRRAGAFRYTRPTATGMTEGITPASIAGEEGVEMMSGAMTSSDEARLAAAKLDAQRFANSKLQADFNETRPGMFGGDEVAPMGHYRVDTRLSNFDTGGLVLVNEQTGKALMVKSTMLTTTKITLFSDRPLAKHAALAHEVRQTLSAQ